MFTSYILDIQIFGRTTGLPSHSYPLTRFGSFLCRSRCIAALVWIAPFMASAIHFLDPLLWERPGVTKQQENTKKTLENMKNIWNLEPSAAAKAPGQLSAFDFLTWHICCWEASFAWRTDAFLAMDSLTNSWNSILTCFMAFCPSNKPYQYTPRCLWMAWQVELQDSTHLRNSMWKWSSRTSSLEYSRINNHPSYCETRGKSFFDDTY